MAVELQQTLNRVGAKAQIVLERYRLMKQNLQEAQARIDDLEEQLLTTRRENQRLRNEADFLKMAAIISPQREDIERTRRVLSDLVREIDRCITDLNE